MTNWNCNTEEYDRQIWERVKAKSGAHAKTLSRVSDISYPQVSRYLRDDNLGNISEKSRDKLLIYLGYEDFDKFRTAADKEMEPGKDDSIDQVFFHSKFHINMPARPEFFLGRAPLLKQIHIQLTDQLQRDDVLLLSSIGGMGKTTLLHEYLNRDYCRKYFKWIVYVSVHKNLEVAFIEAVASALQIDLSRILSHEKPVEAIVLAMQQLEGHNLVAIDNINEYDYEDLVKIYRPLRKTGWKILITTRTKPDGMNFVDVEELHLDDARLLFLHYYVPDNVTRDVESLNKYLLEMKIKSVLDQLLNHIKNHTLFTELLAKTGNKKRATPLELLEHLQKEDVRNEPKVDTGAHPYHAENQLRTATLHQYMLSIFDTDYLQGKTADAELADENRARIIMLHFFSILPSVEIPVEHLEKLWEVTENDINEFESRMDMLKQTGWIKGEQSYSKDHRLLLYKMHHLIQEVVYEKLKPDTYSCALLIRKMSETMKNRRALRQSEQVAFRDYFNHALAKIKQLSPHKS